MPTTEEIARTHGHTGPVQCEDCNTTQSLHYGSWYDPATGESGDFIQCCACGIKAGDPAYIHDHCEAPDEDDEPDTQPQPQTQVFHSPGGWMQPDYSDWAACTTNHHRKQDGRPLCTDTPVWRVVQDYGLHLGIGHYCDADLPDEHRHLTPAGPA
ncbi:hypothetical protein ACFUJU_13650 [Streptomyces sp. NPDC057235]|uniref:hypothetical protein n=1 Tax=Streptomyces sp. NPDC057235 TaxID=3346058 RepID=UPI00362F5E64